MARDTYGEHLRAVPLFAELDDHEIDVIGRAATDLHLSAGTVLMREGSVAHEIVIVREGVLEVTRDGVHIADIGPGEIAGEIALLTHARRTATVTAKTDLAALHIDGRAFTNVLDEAPRIAVKLLPILAARVIESSERHSD